MPHSPTAQPQRPVVRFAPSPNGFLHLGHAFSALMNERVAKAAGGTLLLRFEDIDIARCTPAYADAITEDLAWLGLVWERPVWRQSERFPAYRAALDRLDSRHLLYPCFCTRGDIARAIGGRPDWPRDPDGSPLYPGTCRRLPFETRAARHAAGQPSGLRLDMARALACVAPLGWTEWREGGSPERVAADPDAWGDVLLARKDIPASYHIAVVLDDAAQGVTDVVRGVDLFAATSLHRLLQTLLDLREPTYRHHRLILGADGEKLSKSRQSPTLRTLRAAGERHDAIRRRLGFG